MSPRARGWRRLAAAALLAAFLPGRACANPSMANDFQSMMDWLSHELAQGIAFNAGSTFDPPHEIYDRRLAPDISLGIGHLPLDHSKFPAPQTPALADYHPENIFPKTVNFPNLAAHLRGGLPGRFDFAIRAADMTTPSGYKISANAPASGQSNSIGASLRKHFFGGEDMPLLSLGAHYNHVYGRFIYQTKLNVNTNGFVEDANVNGGIIWNVNSFGLNAVLSQTFGKWTPFGGFGYNYTTGSVRSYLKVDPVNQAFGITPFSGEASEHPEQNSGRVILGFQRQGAWLGFFTNAEVKAIGINKGQSWIMQSGLTLPFHIGTGGGKLAKAKKTSPQMRRELTTDESEALVRFRRPRPERPHKEVFSGAPATDSEKTMGTPTMIFIQ